MVEPRPGKMHPVDRAFYDLTIDQRNRAWRRIENLEDAIKKYADVVYDTSPGHEARRDAARHELLRLIGKNG